MEIDCSENIIKCELKDLRVGETFFDSNNQWFGMVTTARELTDYTVFDDELLRTEGQMLILNLEDGKLYTYPTEQMVRPVKLRAEGHF